MIINTVKYIADIDNPTVNTAYLVNGKRSTIIGSGDRYEVGVNDWIAEGNIPEPAYTLEELDAYQLAKDNSVYEKELVDLDNASIRDMREWIASQASAPQSLKDRESQAIIARSKLK